MNGDVTLALASYNAGENRVVRWKAERPGVEQDEFIDDIPFPETQNYVKRILGTAEDYRYLYGSGLLDPNRSPRLPVMTAGPKPAGVAAPPWAVMVTTVLVGTGLYLAWLRGDGVAKVIDGALELLDLNLYVSEGFFRLNAELSLSLLSPGVPVF